MNPTHGTSALTFALDEEHRLLYTFPSESAALVAFTREELESELVVFFNHRGVPQRVELAASSFRLFQKAPPTRRLIDATDKDLPPLQKRLSEVEHVDEDGPLSSLEAVRRHLDPA